MREQAAQRTAERISRNMFREGAPVGHQSSVVLAGARQPNYQASLVVDPPDGRMPPMTAEAIKLNAARQEARRGHNNDTWEDQSFYDRCISRGVMGSILPVIYNNGNQIVQRLEWWSSATR